MSMPALDPARFRFMRLVDLTHTLPVPGSRRLFSQEASGEQVDMHDPFWAMLAADGSIEPVPPPESATPDPLAG